MKLIKPIVLAAIAAIARADVNSSAVGNDNKGADGGVTVKVLGQSGKMTVTNVAGKQVTITMDSLYELDAAGNQVGKSGPNSGKHSRNTFASVPFSIDKVPTRTALDGVPCDKIDFDTTLLGSSKLKVSTLIFLGSGNIAPTGNESWPVAGGSFKFSIDVSDWPFCTSADSGNPCQGATGEYLELSIAIKGVNGGKPSATGNAKTFDLGGNVTLDLSDEVRIDGSWVSMPSGYPKMVSQGSKTIFQFRLPKFASSAFYDPLVQGMGAPPPSPGAPETVVVSLTAAGTVSDYSQAQLDSVCGKIAAAAGLDESAASCTIRAASVIITASLEVPTGTTVQSVVDTLSTTMGDASLASSLLGIQVESAPSITDSSGTVIEPSAGGLSTGALIGIIVGAVAGVLLVVVVVYCTMCKKQASTVKAGA